MKFEKKDIRRTLVVIFASFIYAFNIVNFVNTAGLYPGGFSGITVLAQRIALDMFGVQLPFAPINLALNVFPVYIGFRYVGKKFTLLSCLSIFISSIFVDICPTFHITDDILLAIIFGAIINAFSSALCLRENASGGGTDFIAMYLSEKKGVESWNLILGMNACILCVAGLLFGFEKALYSILYQYATTVALNTLYTKYRKVTLFVVTSKPREVCDAISEITNHGATLMKGVGSYDNVERDIVYSIISRGDSKKVFSAIKKLDEHAFVNEIQTSQLSGKFWMQRAD